MDYNLLIGLLIQLVSSILFGSMYVPIRKFNIGDGLFVQWMMAVAIFVVGMLVNLYLGQLPFYPLALLGGALWAVGNAMVVPIIQLVGMALGLLFWNIINLIVSWVIARFGLFGLNPQVPVSIGLNYAAVVLSIVSGVMFLLVRNTSTTAQSTKSEEADKQQEPFLERLIPRQKRILGICLSAIAGLFFGTTLTPVIYIQDHRNQTEFPRYLDASPDGLPYVFAYNCGILFTATVIFFVYCISMRNRPCVNPRVILPAFLCGGMWGVAQAGIFVANALLSMAVTTPIISRLPAMIGALWGILMFKEITGKRNLAIAGFAMSLTILSGVLTSLSSVEL